MPKSIKNAAGKFLQHDESGEYKNPAFGAASKAYTAGEKSAKTLRDRLSASLNETLQSVDSPEAAVLAADKRAEKAAKAKAKEKAAKEKAKEKAAKEKAKAKAKPKAKAAAGA